MTEIFDALEICLQEMESGADLDSVLARFPEHAEELRPILQTAVKARDLVTGDPSPDVVRRSRAKVLQRAAELRESNAAPYRRGLPVFSRLAISFALTALFLASSAGLVNASASALPGENLYPVKRGWENIRLFLIFNPQAREMLKDEFENERLHEVNELLAEGRHEVIQFAGVYMQVNGVDYVSGLMVVLPADAPALANGDAVIVTGQTNAQGLIEISRIEILPDGAVVPLGNPIEVENTTGEDASEGDSSSGSGGEAGATSQPDEYELSGTLETISETSLMVSGMTILIDQVKVEGQLCVGQEVEIKGYYTADGSFVAEEIKSEGQCAESSPSGSNGNSNSNSNSNSNDESQNSGSSANSNGDDSGGDDNSNSDDDSNDGGDDGGDSGDDDGDNSGSGGGGDD